MWMTTESGELVNMEEFAEIVTDGTRVVGLDPITRGQRLLYTDETDTGRAAKVYAYLVKLIVPPGLDLASENTLLDANVFVIDDPSQEGI